MHQIMRYSWDEIMAMVTIFSTVGGGLIWLLHLAIKSGTEGLSQLINRVDNSQLKAYILVLEVKAKEVSDGKTEKSSSQSAG